MKESLVRLPHVSVLVNKPSYDSSGILSCSLYASFAGLSRYLEETNIVF